MDGADNREAIFSLFINRLIGDKKQTNPRE